MNTALHLLEIGLLVFLIYRPMVVKMQEMKQPGVTDAPGVQGTKPEHCLRLIGLDGSLHGEVTTYADVRPDQWSKNGKTYKPSMWRTKDGGVWLFKETK